MNLLGHKWFSGDSSNTHPPKSINPPLSILPWQNAVQMGVPTIPQEIERLPAIPVAFGEKIVIPVEFKQAAPDTPHHVFWSGCTFDFTLPAIRYRKEPMRENLHYICDKKCLVQNKPHCKHVPKLEDGVPIYYVNNIGNFLIKSLQVVDDQGVKFCTTWYQQEFLDVTALPQDKSSDEEVGRFETEEDQILWCRSKPKLVVRCRVHLPPFRSQAPDFIPSHAIPLSLLRKTQWKIILELQNLRDCYSSQDHSVPFLLYDKRPLEASDLSMRMFLKVMYTNDFTLTQFCRQPALPLFYYWPHMEAHTDIVENVVPYMKKHHQKSYTINIPFSGCLLEMVWFIQPLNVKQDRHGNIEQFVPFDPHVINPFDWSAHNGDDCFTEAHIHAQGKSLSPRHDANYYRQYIRQQYSILSPRFYIYGAGFTSTINRFDVYTGGLEIVGVDHSKPTYISLELTLQPYIQHFRYFVLLRRSNIANLRDGTMTFQFPVLTENGAFQK